MSTKAWSDAHITLKRLYDERCPPGMSQAEFGAEFGVGNQSMVSQYLCGTRPLNFEAAAKFAKGLRCTIYDISPEMAEALKAEIVPVLGPKAWLRVASKVASVVAAALLVVPPSPADAREVASVCGAAVYYVKRLICRLRHQVAGYLESISDCALSHKLAAITVP